MYTPGYSTAVCRVPGATTAYSGVARGDDCNVHPRGTGGYRRQQLDRPATIAGRWVALVVLAIAALALIFPTFAQRIAGPAVSAGNLLNTRSGQTRGTLSAFLAGLAVGLLWSPCAGPILGAIFSLNIAGHSAIATGHCWPLTAADAR